MPIETKRYMILFEGNEYPIIMPNIYSTEKFEKELEDMATRYQMEKEKVADLLSDDDKKNLRNDICLKKAAKFVTSKAK